MGVYAEESHSVYGAHPRHFGIAIPESAKEVRVDELSHITSA